MDKLLLDIPDLITERMHLRPYRAGDGAMLAAAIDESRDSLRPWIPWADRYQTVEDSELYARRSAGQFMLREDLAFGMFKQEDGSYLGGLGLHRIDWHTRAFEVGYWLHVNAVGNGYISEAVFALCDMAFSVLDASRVFIRCASENSRSWAVPERLGFHFEGTLLNQVRDDAGTLFDMRHYVMTPELWRSRG